MIKGLLTQDKLPFQHGRDFGCYFRSLTAMVEDVMGELLGPTDLQDIFNDSVKLGYIKDNNVPIKLGNDWYRVFVIQPYGLISITSLFFNEKVIASELYRGKICPAIQGTTHTVIEYETLIGSHFTLGVVNDNMTVSNLFDSGPQFHRGKVKSIRHWRVIKHGGTIPRN